MTSTGRRLVDTEQRPLKTWRQVHEESAPLLLSVAHDALTAKVIEQAGYPAYQIGGFALVGSRFGYPDIDLAQFGENSGDARHHRGLLAPGAGGCGRRLRRCEERDPCRAGL